MRQRVLIVDDSKAIHVALKTLLRDLPIDISSAYDGELGVAMAAALKPDLVLLDVDMPRLSGYDACKRLKADPATGIIPVIFLSGQNSTEEKIRGLDMGAFDYVIKPFEPAELVARVNVSLRMKFLLDLLSQKAMIDGLTGLWNRAYLQQHLAIKTSEASRENTPLSCMIIDVDHFKKLNDVHGHPFGDEVLRGVSQMLLEQSRGEDVVCRYGGEEFVVLMPGVAGEQALSAAERMRKSIAALTFKRGDLELSVTVSVGLADTVDSPGASLVSRADEALYHAKRNGRDRVVKAGSKPVELSHVA
jgi:diguanylate cyclase (GGDEF)-like protein